jgi:ankyrin repeat protein
MSIHEAARAGDVDELKELLEIGDLSETLEVINSTDKHKRSALHLASFFGRTAAVELLLSLKADVHQAAQDGFTPLHFASQNGHLPVVKVLVQSRANIDRCLVNSKRTALHLAALKGHAEVIKYLIAKGADLEKEDRDHKNPLDLIKDAEVKIRTDEFIQENQGNSKKQKIS